MDIILIYILCSESWRILICITLQIFNSRHLVYKLVLDISAKGWIEIFLTPGHNPGSSSQILLSGADKSKWEPDKSIVTEISTFLCRSWGTIWVLLHNPWVTLPKSSHDRWIDNATIIELSTPYLSKIVMITPFKFQTSRIFPNHMFQ